MPESTLRTKDKMARTPDKYLKHNRHNAWPSESKASLLKQCRAMVERGHKALVAFYSNPPMPGQSSHLQSLTREMRFVIHSLNPYDYHIEPATTPTNIHDALHRHRPSVVILSAHSSQGVIALENDQGKVQKVNVEQLTTMLAGAYAGTGVTPACVVFLACDTMPFGRGIVKTFGDKCAAVCWDSEEVEDDAASYFAMGFIRDMTEQIGAPGFSTFDARKAFNAACSDFENKGFEYGDPGKWLALRQVPPRSVRGTPVFMHGDKLVKPKGVVTPRMRQGGKMHPNMVERLNKRDEAKMNAVSLQFANNVHV